MPKLFRLSAFAALASVLASAHATPLSAKDSLGVYSNWAAFRDDTAPRCYAIAKPRGRNGNGAFASIASWPRQNIRNQVHIRLSRAAPEGSEVTLRIGDTRFQLAVRGRDAWAQDKAMDAAIVAALRSGESMRVAARGFSNRYSLSGVATAMDAAVVGCSDL